MQLCYALQATFPSRRREIDPALQLRPEQLALTPAQEAEAGRFADEFIHRQLSTEPVDERQAEAFLCQAYAVAGLAPPQRIQWLDGPLQLLTTLAPLSRWGSLWDSFEADASVGGNIGGRARASIRASIWDRVEERVWFRVGAGIRASVGRRAGDGVRAYENAAWLAFCSFFDAYLAPNDLVYLAHFNELVSGYWLGQEVALLVRRPEVLSHDVEGRLHSETGKAIEYPDGWGFYAWHGVEVPKKVIVAPEALTHKDFQRERNVEVRRVMQERMSSRFVPELGGWVIDSSPSGTLYEVALPGDPERVARYVQVQDASTSRQYYLRVPPSIQTAAGAVAWSFGLSVEAYAPAQET
jgi:hypothetical protein